MLTWLPSFITALVCVPLGAAMSYALAKRAARRVVKRDADHIAHAARMVLLTNLLCPRCLHGRPAKLVPTGPMKGLHLAVGPCPCGAAHRATGATFTIELKPEVLHGH